MQLLMDDAVARIAAQCFGEIAAFGVPRQFHAEARTSSRTKCSCRVVGRHFSRPREKCAQISESIRGSPRRAASQAGRGGQGRSLTAVLEKCDRVLSQHASTIAKGSGARKSTWFLKGRPKSGKSISNSSPCCTLKPSAKLKVEVPKK